MTSYMPKAKGFCSDEKILSEEVISELHKLAGRDLPPSAADEMKEELDDLEAEAEMTQE